MKEGDIVYAIANFVGDSSQNQLSLVGGEEIRIVALTESGWHYGEKVDGSSQGYFPVNYVTDVSPQQQLLQQQQLQEQQQQQLNAAEETKQMIAKQMALMEQQKEDEEKRRKEEEEAERRRKEEEERKRREREEIEWKKRQEEEEKMRKEREEANARAREEAERARKFLEEREEKERQEKLAKEKAERDAKMTAELELARENTHFARIDFENSKAKVEAARAIINAGTSNIEVPLTEGCTCYVISDFPGDVSQNQLILKAKDRIKIVALTETGWHYGEKLTGDKSEGYFPSNYVKNEAVDDKIERIQLEFISAEQIFKVHQTALQRAEAAEEAIIAKYTTDASSSSSSSSSSTSSSSSLSSSTNTTSKLSGLAAANSAEAKAKAAAALAKIEAEDKKSNVALFVDVYKGYKKPSTLPYTPDNIDRSQFTFLTYAEKYFRKHKKGLTAKNVETKDMIHFSIEPIENSLLEIPDIEVANEAVQLYKQVLIFMGDMETRTLAENSIVDIIVAGVKGPALRDEILVQVCKQLNENPNPLSTRKGWVMLQTLVDYFPPSDLFLNTMINFLHTFHSKPEFSDEAKTTEMKLRKTLQVGARATMPTKIEFTFTVASKPMPVKVYLCDETFKTLPTESQMTVGEFLEKIAAVLCKSKVDSKTFALFENGTFNGTILSTLLPLNDRIRDVVGNWEARRCNDAKLLYKIKIFTPNLMKQAEEDPDLANVIYQQAIHGIVNEFITVEQPTLFRLAALQLYVDLAGDTKQLATRLEKKVASYFPDPKSTFKKTSLQKSLPDIEKAILDLKGWSQEKCKYEYLKIVSGFPTFGKDLFEVELKSGGTNLPKKLVIGIDGSGMTLIDSTRLKTLQFIGYDKVEQWGASEKLLVLMIKTGTGSQQYQFACKIGQQICDLISEITVS